MNRLTHLAAAVLVASAGAWLFAAQQKPTAHEHEAMKPLAEATADIAGDGITGTATFAEYQHGDSRLVQIHLTVSGLKPGQHGVHLHAVGKCEAPFTSAGGHYDPGPAGNPDPDANHPYHMGDLPNLTVGADGKGQLHATTTRVTISRRAAHARRRRRLGDHHPRQPRSGNYRRVEVRRLGRPRVACGVITKK